MCLVLASFEGVTNCLSVAAASTYAVSVSSLSTTSSVRGIMGCLYHGIGQGAGSFIAGALINIYGYRTTFTIFGVFALVAASSYALVNFCYLRKQDNPERSSDNTIEMNT